jgi:UDP-2-acetamido-3-amino-2,3-dideoxy-glucuronate N-acetyltransferase
MNANLRIAVVGAGYWGVNLVRVAAQTGVLAAVCDADAANLEKMRAQYPRVAMFGDYADVLAPDAEIDAVVLAVPALGHVDCALAAIDAGKHVFVEKPLALNVKDAERIVSAAARAGVKVFVGHLPLYHPGFRALMQQIRAGSIGEVMHVRSRRLSWGKLRNFENVWWSFAPHDVAIVLAIFGGELPLSVAASQTAPLRPTIADFAHADYVFSGRRSSHIEVSWLDVDKSTRLDIFGRTGILTLTDGREGALLIRTPAEAQWQNGVPVLRRKDPIDVPFLRVEPLAAELNAFVAWIQLDIKPPTDALEGLDVVRVLALTQAAADERSAAHAVFA